MLAQIEKNNQQRRFRENQKKLSDMLMKSAGGLDSEYSVGETGNISVKYKSKKDKRNFATATREASQKIAAGEDFDTVAGELQIDFPSNYKATTEKYLKKSLPKSIFKSPKFKEGKYLSAYFSKDIAKLEPATKNFIKDIEEKVRTEEDFKEVVIIGRTKLEEEGIDVDAILEYFDRDKFGNER